MNAYNVITQIFLFLPNCSFFAFVTGIFGPYLLHRLIFRQESLAAPITNKLKKKWLSNTEYHLESGLVDLEAATKVLLNDVMVSAEKKRKFRGQYKKMVLDILLKLSKRSPL